MDPLNNNPSTNSESNNGFPGAIKVTLLSLLTGVIAQNLFDWFGHSGMESWMGLLGGAILVLGFASFFGKSLYRIIDTPYFAITGLLFIAIGTALGTFVTQNSPPPVFIGRYGETGSQVLQFFQLEDVFHSWWYVILFLLMAISLVKISLRRDFSVANLGFYLAHLGPILILFGFWFDYFAGFRGIIQLLTGQETDLVTVFYRSTNRVQDSVTLDFKVRLDHFEFENFEPDHRIQVWKNEKVDRSQQSKQRIVASLPLEINQTTRIYNTDITLQLKEFFPNFYLKYAYPEQSDTIEAKDPGILIELETPHGKDMIQLRSSKEGKNILDEPVFEASFEFYWELPEDIEKEISSYSPDSEWAQKNRIVFAGKQGTLYESFDGTLSSKPVETNHFYPMPGKENMGYTVLLLFPDAAYLSSGPATRNDNQENPVALLDVNSKSWPKSKAVHLYPRESGPGGQFSIPGTDYMLALESIKDKETKYWKSDVSILDKDGTVKKQKSIKVNQPLTYSGYRFYQTDYDPKNPNYSGIGVSYSPGLYIIYFGFYVLVAGVFMLFYMRLKKEA